MQTAFKLAVALILGPVILAMARNVSYGNHPYQFSGRALTVAESYVRGFADVVRAAAEANLRNSQAAKNYQQVRSMHLDNRLKRTQTFFEMRRMNRSYRDAERRPRPTREQLERMAASARPPRLAPEQLDPSTGAINWPLGLRYKPYRIYTQELESQFVLRADGGGVADYETYQAILDTVDEAQAALKKDVGKLKPYDYVQAKRFLQSLAYEARFPISSQQLVNSQ